VIVVFALLAIILVYIAANLRTVNSLGRELKLLDRQQTRRLQIISQRTNTPPAIPVATNSASASRTN
jgi:type II secretory pathway pseudopilin PulG